MAETGKENQQGEVLAPYVITSNSSIKAAYPRALVLAVQRQQGENPRQPKQ